jgi:3-oxoadipate enol-lactonase
VPDVIRPQQPKIHYELDDFTDPWRKAPVILLQHGFSRSSRFWYSWVPYLSRFYRVVRPDMRGKGSSEIPADLERGLAAECFMDDLNAIIDHLRVDSVHYCGESLGGLFGMAFAARYPKRIRTLSLVGAPPYISEHDKKSTTYGYSSRIEALQNMGTKAWVAASSAGRRFPPDVDPGMIRWFDDEMGKGNVDVLVTMTRWMADFTAVPLLPQIKAPVLGLYPSEGPVTDDEQLQLLRDHIPNLRIVSIPTRYHAIASFEPAACALQVLHFAAQADGISCHE